MKGIECAFVGRLTCDAELRRAESGREWLCLSVATGDDKDWQTLNVGSWAHNIQDLAPALLAGVKVYVEGKIKLRTWGGEPTLSVQASLVQPLGLIGQHKPKRTRAPAKRGSPAYQSSAAFHGALPFNDPLDL